MSSALGFVENNMPDAMSLEGFNLLFRTSFFRPSADEQQVNLFVESRSIFENTIESGLNQIVCALCIWCCARGTWCWCWSSSHIAHKESAECAHPCKFIHVGENGLYRLHTSSRQTGHCAVLPVGLSAEGLIYKRHQIFNVDLSHIVRGSLRTSELVLISPQSITIIIGTALPDAINPSMMLQI